MTFAVTPVVLTPFVPVRLAEAGHPNRCVCIYVYIYIYVLCNYIYQYYLQQYNILQCSIVQYIIVCVKKQSSGEACLWGSQLEICIHTHTLYIYIYIYNICVYIYIYTLCVYIYIYIYTRTHIFIQHHIRVWRARTCRN